MLEKTVVVIGSGPMVEHCLYHLSKKFKKILVIVNGKKNYTNSIRKTSIAKIYKLKKIDYFFSIMNKKIISKKILKKIVFAINFHDSPLPKYAGLYPSTFGILNNERQWGCTWHFMSDRVDKGDIISQKKFQINQGKTAYDLDVLSAYYGIVLFERILTYLPNLNSYRRKQNIKKFSYYGKKDFIKVLKKSTVSLEDRIENIIKIFRAFKLSKEKTTKIFSPKLKIKRRLYIIEDIKILKRNINKNIRRKRKENLVFIKKGKFELIKSNFTYQFTLKKKINLKLKIY